jgi:uncharacterized 2Fe-2S/4Fe-4S cluster protein (DUF4445 family)
MSHRPLAFALALELPHPSFEDKVADAERVQEALRISGLNCVSIPLPIVRRLPEELRKNNFSVTLVIGHDAHGFRVLDISRGKIYGIAMDIGTTTLECALFELDTQQRLDVSEGENPQIRFGADVLSRVQMAMTGKGATLTNH